MYKLGTLLYWISVIRVYEELNLNRLGAVYVWGGETLAFAQAANVAGIKKMIINGSAPPEDMKAINNLGFLASCYDTYQDVFSVEGTVT